LKTPFRAESAPPSLEAVPSAKPGRPATAIVRRRACGAAKGGGRAEAFVMTAASAQ
jgi:hypothetical protein